MGEVVPARTSPTLHTPSVLILRMYLADLIGYCLNPKNVNKKHSLRITRLPVMGKTSPVPVFPVRVWTAPWGLHLQPSLCIWGSLYSTAPHSCPLYWMTAAYSHTDASRTGGHSSSWTWCPVSGVSLCSNPAQQYLWELWRMNQGVEFVLLVVLFNNTRFLST